MLKKLPKIIKAENTVLSSGLNVNTPFVRGIVPAGTEITKVRVIAGYGTSTEFRDAGEYVINFGGNKDKWMKKGGIVFTGNFIYDIHWCEYYGKQYDHKLKEVRRSEKKNIG